MVEPQTHFAAHALEVVSGVEEFGSVLHLEAGDVAERDHNQRDITASEYSTSCTKLFEESKS